MASQNSSKSISPFLSLSRSLIMWWRSSGLSFMPTPSSSCSNSSTEMWPVPSMGTNISSLSDVLVSCLKRQKICRNSSLSSAVMPCFFLGIATSSTFFLGGNFSAALMARSNSFKLTSPPVVETRDMITENSASVALKPISAKPVRSSSESIKPSPLVSIFLKRSVALILLSASLSTKHRMTSSASKFEPVSLSAAINSLSAIE
mmetsp:Transcript_114105/g.179642  ORF Transcript_114105/g.179642 Transcript_114105/m.179642 type:complete len:204 (-) Transcript_114105:17-628(-)